MDVAATSGFTSTCKRLRTEAILKIKYTGEGSNLGPAD